MAKKAARPKGLQTTASQEEQAERAAQLRTQGRKGCKATRINMAFTPENYEFIRIMSRIHGMNLTQFANLVVERYRKEHPDAYEKAKAIIDSIKGSGMDEEK